MALRVACAPWFADYLRAHDALLLNLDHPNLRRVFEIGEVEGRAYTAEAALLAQTLALTLGHLRPASLGPA